MPIYVLLNMAGEYFTNLLHDFFRFPWIKTIRNYCNKFIEEYGISKDLFDVSCKSIIKLLNLFWNGNDNKFVISIDVASVNEGLMDDITIEKETVHTITTNPDKFHEFYEKHKDEIVKYYFVVYLNNKWTKMTDDMPLKLFTIHSLKVLIENFSFCAASCSIPFILLDLKKTLPIG